MASGPVSRYAATVLRRLLLLLALIVALPATARPACHDAGVPMAHAGLAAMSNHADGHGKDRQVPGAPHDCLGCIPPDMLLGARVTGAVLPPARVVPAPAVVFAPGEALRPTPPPPKNA